MSEWLKRRGGLFGLVSSFFLLLFLVAVFAVVVVVLGLILQAFLAESIGITGKHLIWAIIAMVVSFGLSAISGMRSKNPVEYKDS